MSSQSRKCIVFAFVVAVILSAGTALGAAHGTQALLVFLPSVDRAPISPIAPPTATARPEAPGAYLPIVERATAPISPIATPGPAGRLLAGEQHEPATQ